MPLRWAVVHEAEADYLIATELADRVLLGAIDWLEDQTLEYQRVWIDRSPSGDRFAWKHIPQRARDAGIKVHGHFDGAPGQPDAAAARRALFYVRHCLPEVDAVVLVRDSDGQAERRQGLEQARRAPGFANVVIAVAHVERECWVISGFEPENEAENERLQVERQHLGFDPRVQSHELTACKDDSAKRSPKRVLRALTHADSNRERSCWMKTPVALLIERGRENGLGRFLDEVDRRLVPRVSGRDSADSSGSNDRTP